MSRMTSKVLRFDDPAVRPMGFFGSWKFQGMTSLGVITFNEGCIPSDGEFKEPGASDLDVRIVERIKYLPGEEVVDPVPLIILTVFFLITIGVILYVCRWCIHRERHRNQQKKQQVTPAPWTMPSEKKPIAVGDGVPNYAGYSDADISEIKLDVLNNDSARVPLQGNDTVEPRDEISLREI